MFLICVTVGFMFIATKYKNVINGVKNLCKNISEDDNKQVKNIKLKKIFVADTLEKSDNAVQLITKNMIDDVLGFDCEWVGDKNVSLIQLATKSGLCVLFRIGKMEEVPLKLQELLKSKSVLKVGVAPVEDGIRLKKEYGVSVFGAVDLRVLADYLKVPNRRSLAALSLQYLNVDMNKDSEVRCSDWNADILTDKQIVYAATDAYTSVLIYHQMYKSANKKHSFFKQMIIYFRNLWKISQSTLNDFLPDEIVDKKCRICYPNEELNLSPEQRSPPKVQKNIENNLKKSNIPTRKEPLYHNCYLQAPDGEVLCTCDRKKALWYINKELGVKISDDPLTVRLKFEPSGRASGKVGQYYTQVKVNQCVVCGSQDKFIKKNVVPREYRKYFPLVMKAHQSHDVLLLCLNCHELSNRFDKDMRRKLEMMCDAPLSKPLHEIQDESNQRKYNSTVRILSSDKARIPVERRRELESQVLSYSHMQNRNYHSQQSINFQSKPHISHGLKVVQYFSNKEKGLVLLEQMWREHFVNNMKPKYLPDLWSVNHNQERLKLRQIQNRIDIEDATLAGLNN